MGNMANGQQIEFEGRRTLSTKEAAAYLGISYAYLRKLRTMGPTRGGMTPPPHFYIDPTSDKSIRYLKEDLDRWLDTRPKKFDMMPEVA